MRRTKSLLFILLATIVSVSSVFAQTVGTMFTIDNIEYTITKKDLTTHDNEVAVKSIGGSGAVTVPATVVNAQDRETYKVTSTVKWANPMAKKGVTAITFSEGLTSIADGAFNDSPTLTSVTIPASCTTIGAECFENCRSLTAFNVASGNPSYTSSSDGLLLSKDGSTLVYFPSGKSGDYTIPSSITSIGKDAFRNCSNLRKLTIPASVTDMYFSMGENKPSISGSATYIDVDDANPNYKDIDGVLYSKDGTKLCAFPAKYTGAIRPYTIAAGAKQVTAYAFYSSNVVSVNLNDVQEIAPLGFKSNGFLESVTIGKDVAKIGNGAFAGCEKLTAFDVDATNNNYKATDGVIFSKDGKQLVLFPSGKPGDYTIPEGTETLLNQSFYNAKKIGAVTAPTSLKTIGDWAFGYNTLSGITFTAPSSLESIGTDAFTGSQITTITLPASLTTIKNAAFEKVEKLTSVYIADGSALTSLSDNAFANNPELTTFEFLGSSNLEKINKNAFVNDVKLTSITIPATVNTIEANAFQNTPSLATVTFAEPAIITTISANAFAQSGITSINIPESVTNVETQAFDNCSKLTTVHIPQNLTNIGLGAFNKCDEMLKFTVDESNENYSSLAGMLTNKNKTELVVFPAGQADSRYTLIPYFEKVRPYAFYGSKKLNNITFPRSVTEIGDRAIALCENLKSISFMGTDNVPALTSNVMYESGNTKDITIYVRKAWYENAANNATIERYNTTFKEVHPSFITTSGYDRGTEFFPTSTTNVGVISFYTPRTSVIISNTATEATTDATRGKSWNNTYAVSSVLDYAYENATTVKDIVFLADIGSVGLKAFRANSQLQGIYFVGNTPAELNSTLYEMNDTDEPFNDAQKIYVKQSKVNDYSGKWNVGNNQPEINYQIPVQTSNHGGTVCYPFDVKYAADGGIVPYLPIDYTYAYTGETPVVRAVSVNDNYIPAFVGTLIRSKDAVNAESYCQIDEDQSHNTTTIAGLGYNAGTYRMTGLVEDTRVEIPSGKILYAFSKSKGAFVQLKNGTTVPYFKAYLALDNTTSPIKGFTFSFEETKPAGISSLTEGATQKSDAPYYNLNGTRANVLTKGVYIQNGKKVIIK